MSYAATRGLGVLAGLLLGGCAPGPQSTDSDSRVNLLGDSDFVAASCAWDPQAGPSVVAFPQNSQEVSLAFGKPINYSLFEPLLNASTNASVQYIQSQGVDLFRASGYSNSCPNFRLLPEPPAKAKWFWDQLASQSFLLGLFLPARLTSIYSLTRDTIILRVDTTRYTLLHEYMHHLFEQSRKARGIDMDQVLDELDEARAEFNSLSPSLRAGDPVRTATLWLRYIQLQTLVWKNFPLEEVAIEKQMIDEVRRGRLTMATDFDLRSGKAYIQAKYKSIHHRLRVEFLQGSKLSSELAAVRQYALEEAVNRASRELKALERELERIARVYAPAETSPSSGRAQGDLIIWNRSCGHERHYHQRLGF
ncbi:MAG: hypothetical protein N2578_03385 [Bdellovibrionaceae bacterium]|nr:hypothetical protein [Pseudobdellovibrionaceae bacterium]